MREAVVLDAGEMTAVDDACGYVYPVLVCTAVSENGNHAVRGIGGKERDLRIEIFYDRG